MACADGAVNPDWSPQEVPYTPNIDQILSNIKSATSSGQSTATNFQSTTSLTEKNNVTSGPSMSSASDLITPAPPIQLQPRSSSAMATPSDFTQPNQSQTNVTASTTINGSHLANLLQTTPQRLQTSVPFTQTSNITQQQTHRTQQHQQQQQPQNQQPQNQQHPQPPQQPQQQHHGNPTGFQPLRTSNVIPQNTRINLQPHAYINQTHNNLPQYLYRPLVPQQQQQQSHQRQQHHQQQQQQPFNPLYPINQHQNYIAMLRTNIVDSQAINQANTSFVHSMNNQHQEQQGLLVQNSINNNARTQDVANMMNQIGCTGTDMQNNCYLPPQTLNQSAGQFQQASNTPPSSTSQQSIPYLLPTSTMNINHQQLQNNPNFNPIYQNNYSNVQAQFNTNTNMIHTMHNRAPQPPPTRHPQICHRGYTRPPRPNKDYTRPRLSSIRPAHQRRQSQVPVQDTRLMEYHATNLPQQTGNLISESSACNIPSPETQCLTQPPVSVSSTTQPSNVSSMQNAEIQATPETFNKACQVDPRPTTLVSRAMSAIVQVEDKMCQTDDDELGVMVVPKRTYVDRVCSPIVALSLSIEPEKPVPATNPSPTKNLFRRKQTAKKRKHVESDDETDGEIDVLE